VVCRMNLFPPQAYHFPDAVLFKPLFPLS